MPARRDDPSGDVAQEFRRVRRELNVTQGELAHILGLSAKAVQSYEQGWRRPPDSIRRLLMVVFVSHRLWTRRHTIACWEQKRCPREIRKECRAYQVRQGHLCWLVTGTKCGGIDLRDCDKKREACQKCAVYKHLVGRPRAQRVSPRA